MIAVKLKIIHIKDSLFTYFIKIAFPQNAYLEKTLIT